MNTAHLHAGIARAIINPPDGIHLSGYAVREGAATAADEPLTLTVLALRGSDNLVLIVAIDICMIDVTKATELRECCAKEAGIPVSNVMVNVSHTHSAPGVGGYAAVDSADQLVLLGKFWRRLLRGARSSTKEAMAALKPARLTVGWGECRRNINRRQKAPDGSVLLGEDASGPCDSSVGVFRVDEMDGTPIAVAFRYSCHTVTRGPMTTKASPDFVGPARKLVESTLGCLSLFLQGSAGNLNPATGIGQDGEESPYVDEDMRRLGYALGGEVLKIMGQLRTHRRRGTPKLVQSVAVYWLYQYETVPESTTSSITVREISLDLPLVPFPKLEEVERERADWAKRLETARAGGERGWVVNPLVRFDYWAGCRLAAARSGPNPLRVSFSLQTFQIGEFRIVGIPFEVMAETGIALREKLGPNTFVLGYTNGIASYLPTPQVSREGGMEAKLGYKACLVPSEVPGDWEPLICSTIVKSFAVPQ